MSLSQKIQKSWYSDKAYSILKPFSFIFSVLVKARCFAYRSGALKSEKLKVPVIVVGNISVGGTGKTPLVIWLAQFLKSEGFKPGIISRGFKAKKTSRPKIVTPESQAFEVGDEPLLIAQRTLCPVVVFPNRIEAGKLLLASYDCDILISDDGLQHYALKRDIEIALIDAERRFGNGFCLPAGPLREPIQRLQGVDMVLCQGDGTQAEYGFKLDGSIASNLTNKSIKKHLTEFKGLKLNAVAGIGNPNRFFKHLKSFGLEFNEYIFPDHHAFKSSDLAFEDESIVLMTEKDAVKCEAFATEKLWYLPVSAQLPESFESNLINLIKEKCDGQKTTRYLGLPLV